MKGINIDQFDTYLENISFPASKKNVLDSAADSDAPEELLVVLGEIQDKVYDSGADLRRELNTLIQQYEETGPR